MTMNQRDVGWGRNEPHELITLLRLDRLMQLMGGRAAGVVVGRGRQGVQQLPVTPDTVS